MRSSLCRDKNGHGLTRIKNKRRSRDDCAVCFSQGEFLQRFVFICLLIADHRSLGSRQRNQSFSKQQADAAHDHYAAIDDQLHDERQHHVLIFDHVRRSRPQRRGNHRQPRHDQRRARRNAQVAAPVRRFRIKRAPDDGDTHDHKKNQRAQRDKKSNARWRRVEERNIF